MSKGVWYINQCDSCLNCHYQKDNNYKQDSFYWCGFQTLNPNKEVDKRCKYFEIKNNITYSENEIYNAALNAYFYKMRLPYNGRETYLNLPLEEKRKKCIELNIIKDKDFEIIDTKKYVEDNLNNFPIDEEELNARNTEEYLKWQTSVFKRDHYKCQICGSNKNLNAHHLESFSKCIDLRYVVDNGVTLCERHHGIKYQGSFHNIYGTRNFTKDDFVIYKNNQTIERQING